MILKKRKIDAGAHIALSALLLGLCWPGLAGAADFASIHDGSWFDAPNTWGQSSSPAGGDDVWINKVVNFDSSTSGQSVTVSNLDLNGGTLNMGRSGYAGHGRNQQLLERLHTGEFKSTAPTRRLDVRGKQRHRLD